MAKVNKLFSDDSEQLTKLIKKNYKVLYLFFAIVGIFLLERVLLHNDFMNDMRNDEILNFRYFAATLIIFTFCALYIILTIIARTFSQDWTGDKLKLTRINKREDIF